MKFYLLTGYCGAGKSTFAKKFAKENNCRYISIDNFYLAVFGNETDHIHRDFVWDLCFTALKLAKEDGVDVILDTNSPNPELRYYIYERIAKYFDERHIIYIEANVDLCLANNKNRSRVIPDNEMSKLTTSYIAPTNDELKYWTSIIHYINDSNNLNLVE